MFIYIYSKKKKKKLYITVVIESFHISTWQYKAEQCSKPTVIPFFSVENGIPSSWRRKHRQELGSTIPHFLTNQLQRQRVIAQLKNSRITMIKPWFWGCPILANLHIKSIKNLHVFGLSIHLTQLFLSTCQDQPKGFGIPPKITSWCPKKIEKVKCPTICWWDLINFYLIYLFWGCHKSP